MSTRTCSLSAPRRRPATVRLAGVAVVALASVLPTLGSHGGAGAADAAARRAVPRPNLVFVLADDLGWADLQTGLVNDGDGSDFNETPALDRLAEQGTTFDNAYASLNCAPTRMALLSGLDSVRRENNVYSIGRINAGSSRLPLIGPRQGRDDGATVLEDETRTVGETLQDAGYRTGYIGKFQVTRSGDDVVAHHGFDEDFGGQDFGSVTNYFARNGEFNDAIGPELDRFAGDYTQDYVDDDIAPYSSGVTRAQLDALVGTPKHVSDAVADATLDFIDRNDDQPFLAWMSTYAVHNPTDDSQARPDLLAKYRAKPAGADPAVPSYAALVEGLDQSVSRVVRRLETTPDPRNPGHVLADNTLVVFSSDNGGLLSEGASNGPLQGQKSELLEGGVRVPWIVWSHNPRLVSPSRVDHSVIGSTDVYPTLAAYAGAALPAGVPLDGTNLKATFVRGRAAQGPVFAHLPGYLLDPTRGREQRPQSTVRDGQWKLTYSYEDQRLRLNDLSRDLGEADDVAAEQPAVVTRLGRELLAWLDRDDAPLATLRDATAPLTIEVPPGRTYADGRVQRYRRATTVVIQPGQQVPFVLPDQPSTAAPAAAR